MNNFVVSWLYNGNISAWRWFATMQEAKAFADTLVRRHPLASEPRIDAYDSVSV